ncbi:hypothetical protein L1887_40514 [Cichorium endivia]|nr:hypothetical protein L1887_40514 [Cichorium endivia]
MALNRLAVREQFDAEVGQRILAKERAGIHVCGQEAALARKRRIGREARHVGAFHNVRQILAQVGDGRVDVHLVLPLELGPHGAELRLVAVRRRNVVHNVNVDVVEHHTLGIARTLRTRARRTLVDDVAKDHARLGARHLDRRLDRLVRVRRQRVVRRPLHQLQIAQRRKLDRQVLQRLGRLVHHEHIQQDVKLVHVDVRLGVHRIREARQLHDARQLRDKVVLGRLGRARRLRELALVLLGRIVRRLLGELAEREQIVRLHLDHLGLLGELFGLLGLLVLHHLGVRRLGVVQEHLVGLLALGLRLLHARSERLDARHDALHRVLVDRRRRKLGLAHTHDARHDEHRLGAQAVLGRRVRRELGKAQHELGERRCEHRARAVGTNAVGGRRLCRCAKRRGRGAGIGLLGSRFGLDAGGRSLEQTLLGGEDGHLADDLADLLHGLLDVFDAGAVLADDPERAAEDLAGLDVGEGAQQLVHDGRAEVGELFDHLAYKGDDVDGGRVVGVAEELHEHVYDVGGDLGELDGAGVDGLDEKLAVLEVLVLGGLRGVDGFHELLLEQQHDLLDVAAGDHLEGDAERLASDVHVWAGEHAEEVHDERVNDVLVLGTQGVEAVEHDEFDVVVALLDGELDERACGCLYGGGVLGERGERGGGLVLDRVAGCSEELGDGADVARTVGRVAAAVFADEFDDGELHELVLGSDLVAEAEEVLDGALGSGVAEEDEGVALAGGVCLCGEEGLHELGRVDDEVLVLLVYRVDAEDGVLAHVAVAVLETLADGGDERFEKLGLLDFLEEAQCGAANVLVGVLQIIADGVAAGMRNGEQRVSKGMQRRACENESSHVPNEDHLLLEVALFVELGADLPVEVEHLLELLVTAGQDILDDGHEQVGLGRAVEGGYDDASEGLELDLVGAALEVVAQVLGGELDAVAARVGSDDGIGDGLGGRHGELPFVRVGEGEARRVGSHVCAASEDGCARSHRGASGRVVLDSTWVDCGRADEPNLAIAWQQSSRGGNTQTRRCGPAAAILPAQHGSPQAAPAKKRISNVHFAPPLGSLALPLALAASFLSPRPAVAALAAASALAQLARKLQNLTRTIEVWPLIPPSLPSLLPRWQAISEPKLCTHTASCGHNLFVQMDR